MTKADIDRIKGIIADAHEALSEGGNPKTLPLHLTELCRVIRVLADLKVSGVFMGPLTVTSGYRSPQHSVEAAKPRPGSHAMGKAVDIACAGRKAYEVLWAAMEEGFTGFGVDQKGEQRFLHLDIITDEDDFPAARPAIWSY